MQKEIIGNHALYCGDCKDIIASIQDKSFDLILIDPPYGYLKHKLDGAFDENFVFAEFKRVLKLDGAIVMFGRGVSFYRRCMLLSELGFAFKEEIIWNKRRGTSPVSPLMRVHETLAVFGHQNFKIKRTKIPYIQKKEHDLDSMANDINRLKTALNSPKGMSDLLLFLQNNKNSKKPIRRDRIEVDTLSEHNITVGGTKSGNRAINTLQSIEFGMSESSIIDEPRDHYSTVHPTQKPEGLLIRVINICLTNPGTIADFFMGSGSTGIAAEKLGHKFVGVEILPEYFNVAVKRVEHETQKIKEKHIKIGTSDWE